MEKKNNEENQTAKLGISCRKMICMIGRRIWFLFVFIISIILTGLQTYSQTSIRSIFGWGEVRKLDLLPFFSCKMLINIRNTFVHILFVYFSHILWNVIHKGSLMFEKQHNNTIFFLIYSSNILFIQFGFTNRSVLVPHYTFEYLFFQFLFLFIFR